MLPYISWVCFTSSCSALPCIISFSVGCMLFIGIIFNLGVVGLAIYTIQNTSLRVLHPPSENFHLHFSLCLILTVSSETCSYKILSGLHRLLTSHCLHVPAYRIWSREFRVRSNFTDIPSNYPDVAGYSERSYSFFIYSTV